MHHKDDTDTEYESDFDDSNTDATFQSPMDQDLSDAIQAENGVTRKETTRHASSQRMTKKHPKQHPLSNPKTKALM